jgi:hypothetical protein
MIIDAHLHVDDSPELRLEAREPILVSSHSKRPGSREAFVTTIADAPEVNPQAIEFLAACAAYRQLEAFARIHHPLVRGRVALPFASMVARVRFRFAPMLDIQIGSLRCVARFVDEAPATIAAIRRLLPFESKAIHVRWSGESMWIPFGQLDVGVGPENATSYPAVGELLLYPGGVSETELLLPYGACHFASKAGQLAGNHFATVVEGKERLREIGVRCLWHGAESIRISER